MRGTMFFYKEYLPKILSGEKTQTRRLIRPQPLGKLCWVKASNGFSVYENWDGDTGVEIKCPYKIGQNIVVAQSLTEDGEFIPVPGVPFWVKITNIRAENLKDISEEDAIAEGYKSTAVLTSDLRDYTGFYALEHFLDSKWVNDKIQRYGDPWVWVYDFEVVKK